jgi:hypothetical protein
VIFTTHGRGVFVMVEHAWPDIAAINTSRLAFSILIIALAGDIMHIKIFGMHIVILSSYDTASTLMSQASYSDRPILTMVGKLYVFLTSPASLRCGAES